MGRYDPDRMNADDLDPEDLDQLQEWLDHPNTSALHDDLGRAFRALPAEEQLEELEAQLAKYEVHRAGLVGAIDRGGASEETQAAWQRLLAGLDGAIAVLKGRIGELRGA